MTLAIKIYKHIANGCFVWLLSVVCFFGCKQPEAAIESTAAVPPDKAVATFEVEKGFQVELVAAEPLVADPVDMEVDEYGRMYVVEMHGYPLDKSGSGKIKLLTDTDGDGKMDKSVVFADSLVLPNGVMRWKKGILVTDAPNVMYYEDTNGDGKADVKDTVLTGFSLSNPHINVNNPVYGLDNYIHVSHLGAISTVRYGKEFGDEGSEIRFPDDPKGTHLPKNAEGHSVRFRPETHQLEMTSGRGQFGHAFDQWGHHLYASNQNHAYAEVMASPYLTRNKEMPITDAMQSISDHGDVSEIYQITKHPERQMSSGTGVMTSSSGLIYYAGGLFPAPFDQNTTFVCESVSNMVHADKLTDTGSTYKASRVGTPKKEFFASTDAWSRPVNLYVGPDGALYVVDYYRQIIEHPEWMSDEAIRAVDLYSGKTMGRIYRITPTGTPKANWNLKLGDETTVQLVNELSNKNEWWRINSQRLLLDRNDASAVPLLEQMAKNESSAPTRLHALWTLEGLNKLTAQDIQMALQDKEAGIRENAVKLAEIHMTSSPELVASLMPLANDKDAKVRFQLMCTLGSVNTPQSEKIREGLLFRDIGDKWMQTAALSASSSHSASMLKEVLARYQPNVPGYDLMIQKLAYAVGANGSKDGIYSLIAQATQTGKTAGWQGSALNGLAQGVWWRKDKNSILGSSQEDKLIASCFDHPLQPVRQNALMLLQVTGAKQEASLDKGVSRAVSIAEDKTKEDTKRAEAISFLSLVNPAPYMNLLTGMLSPQEQPAVQIASIKILGMMPGLSASQYIIKQWESLTSATREVAINSFMSSPEKKALLLDAVEGGVIKPEVVGAGRSAILIESDDNNIRARAQKLLINHEQDKINDAYAEALTLKGDVAKGKVVYMQNCALCHQIQGKLGPIAFGPDLGTVRSWLAKDIMANILNPNLSIAVGYDLRAVELGSGEVVQGIISAETPAAIKLKISPGVEKTVNRQDIKSLKTINASMMPVLTQKINHQQMADLIAFLQKN